MLCYLIFYFQYKLLETKTCVSMQFMIEYGSRLRTALPICHFGVLCLPYFITKSTRPISLINNNTTYLYKANLSTKMVCHKKLNHIQLFTCLCLDAKLLR